MKKMYLFLFGIIAINMHCMASNSSIRPSYRGDLVLRLRPEKESYRSLRRKNRREVKQDCINQELAAYREDKDASRNTTSGYLLYKGSIYESRRISAATQIFIMDKKEQFQKEQLAADIQKSLFTAAAIEVRKARKK